MQAKAEKSESLQVDGITLAQLLTPTQRKAALACGLETVSELLLYSPLRYISPGRLTDIGQIDAGESVSVQGEVVDAHARRLRNRPGMMLTAHLADSSGEIEIVFFGKDHLVKYWHSQLEVGKDVLVSGKVNLGKNGPSLVHPTIVDLADAEAVAKARQPLAVYPLKNTEKVKQQHLRGAIERALPYAGQLTDTIPKELAQHHKLPTLAWAVKNLHQPQDAAAAARAREYLAYAEALHLQTLFALRRKADENSRALAITGEGGLAEKLPSLLPFALTDSQRAASQQIFSLFSRGYPTSVLLQGDVGSGKTVVALHALLACQDAGGQGVLIAPTEVLAKQHAQTMRQLLGEYAERGTLHAPDLATKIHLLTGSSNTAERRQVLLDLASGENLIVIGTHALLSENVQLPNLALVVIDEQHRFGVKQRAELRSRATNGMQPHVLAMTATPIPRSATLALLGDVEHLRLEPRPRTANVQTFVVAEDNQSWYRRLWQRCREEIAQGGQVFIVCPRIQEEGSEQTHTVYEMAAQLQRMPEFAEIAVGIMHGGLSSDEKNTVMQDFAAKKTSVLISTTVIEVGIDIPAATAMVIMDADRYGLAQLHQLRGRIGRGEKDGICFLLTRQSHDGETMLRLNQVAALTDGQALAEYDLQHRRQGNLSGTVQSGVSTEFKFLDLWADSELVVHARADAAKLIAEDPQLEQYAALKAAATQIYSASEVERS